MQAITFKMRTIANNIRDLCLWCSSTDYRHKYRNANESSSENLKIFQLTRSILGSGKILTMHYIDRVSILQDLPLFQKAITIFTRSIRRLNAKCNAAHLSEYFFQKRIQLYVQQILFLRSYGIASNNNMQHKCGYTFTTRSTADATCYWWREKY